MIGDDSTSIFHRHESIASHDWGNDDPFPITQMNRVSFAKTLFCPNPEKRCELIGV